MQKFSWWNGCLSQIPTGKLQLPVVQPRDWDQKGFSKKVSGTYNKSWLWVGVMLKDWLFLSKTLQVFIPIVLFTCACASTMCSTLWAINKHAVATFHAIWFSTWPLRKGSFDSATIDFSTSWFLLIMLACFLRLSSCPSSFPYVFRVGTAWNGDLWSFSGFTSLVPSASVAQVSWHFHLLGMREPELSRSGSATSDLWMVLLPLFQVDSLDDECQPWKGAGRDKACVIIIHSPGLAWSFSLELLHSSSVGSLHTWCIAFIMVYQILGTLKKQPWKHTKQIFLNVPWVVLSKAQNCQNQLSWKEQWRFNGKTAMVLSTFEAPRMEFWATRLHALQCIVIIYIYYDYFWFMYNMFVTFPRFI